MKLRRVHFLDVVAGAGLALVFLGVLIGGVQWAWSHGAPHTKAQLDAFNDVFMEQVELGDRLFHGDPDAEEEMGVKLSDTGMACAMCHPNAADTHPHEFPKWQEQMSEFATLRDMINWCIEKPNEGETIDTDSEAMKALETYIYWSNRGSQLAPGVH